jgi:hypothetical protein
MFELLVLVLFCWLSFELIRLAFKVTWGLAKIAAVILFVLALPSLIAALLMASGFILLLPVVLVGAAVGILKACI